MHRSPWSGGVRTRLCVAVAFTLPATFLHAGDPPTNPDTPETLDTVVVVGARPISPLTFEIDPRQPRQPIPASDGADYLKTIPGFTAIRNGGTNGDPVLRGMFGSRLNLLSNEGAMPGACPSRMDNPLSYVSPDTFDKLVVIKGPQTVLWGPGASAGTVRFSRDREAFAEPTVQGSGSLLVADAGRNDQVADITLGAPLGYVRASANRSDADDYSDGNGELVPSRWTKWNVDVAAAWTPDPDTLLEAGIGRGDGEARYAGRRMDGSQFLRESASLRFERDNLPGPLDRFEANAYRNRADHVMDNYSLREPNPSGPMPMAMGSNVERVTSGGRAALAWSGESYSGTVGADTQLSRHRTRNGPGVDAWRTKSWTRDATLRNTGVFAELEWTLAEQRRVVAGTRVDRASALDERAMAGKPATPNPTRGQEREEWLQAGFVRFEQGGALGLSWYAGLGYTERMPDYWELVSPNQGPDGAVNAFDGVDKERTSQLDVGLQYRTPRLHAWVSAYVGRIDDYIVFDYVSSSGMGGTTTTTTLARNVDAAIHGMEAGASWKASDQWQLESSVAWAWGANRDEHRPLPQMPPLELKLAAEWKAGGPWSAGMLLRGVAQQQRVALEQGNVVGRDLGPSAGFATLALHAGYRFSDAVQLTAGVDNVFDRYYVEHLNLAGSADFGYPADPIRIAEPGRTWWLRLGVEY